MLCVKRVLNLGTTHTHQFCVVFPESCELRYYLYSSKLVLYVQKVVSLGTTYTHLNCVLYPGSHESMYDFYSHVLTKGSVVCLESHESRHSLYSPKLVLYVPRFVSLGTTCAHQNCVICTERHEYLYYLYSPKLCCIFREL